jgi:threonine aldolase
MAAEAVVFFDRKLAVNMAERRKRAGHLMSKHRFLALQFEAFLAGGCWLRLARHANAMADRLASGLTSVGRPPAWPVEANLVFIVLPTSMEARLRVAGARFYVRHSESLPAGLEPEHCLIRLVTSFATREDEIDRLVTLVAKT